MATKVKNMIDSVDLDKLKLALLIGTPIVASSALAIYLYRKKKSKSSSNDHVSIDKVAADSKIENIGSTEQTPLEKALSSKEKGNKYFKGGKYEKAIQCYDEAINLCPKTDKDKLSTFYQNRAAAFEHLNKQEEVIADCDKALECNAKYIKALFRRAKACESLKRYRECLEDVTAVCVLEGFNKPESLIMAERVLKQVGSDYAKIEYKKRRILTPSMQYIRSYLSTFANDPLNLLRESLTDDKNETIDIDIDNIEKDESQKNLVLEILEKLKDCQYDNILTLCSKVLENQNSTGYYEILLLHGTFSTLYGENTKALEDFEEILKSDADNKIKSNALIKRASLKLTRFSDQPGAMTDLTNAVKEDPENSDVYHHRGQMNLLLDRVEEAVSDFQKSVDLNPDFAITNIQKCYTEYRLALMCRIPLQLQEAMETFEKQLKRFPKCAEGFRLYGQALCDQELYEKADEMFTKACELDPGNAEGLVHKGLLALQWRQDMNKAYDLIKKALEVDNLCELAYETLGTLEIQRGNLREAINLFTKAIKLCKSEPELVHYYSLKAAAEAQEQISIRFGISCSFPN